MKKLDANLSLGPKKIQFNTSVCVSDLLASLERLRGSGKTVGEVGPTLMNWVSVTMETKIRRRRRQMGTSHYLLSYVPL